MSRTLHCAKFGGGCFSCSWSLDSPCDVSFQAHSAKCVESRLCFSQSHLSVMLQLVLERVVLVLPEVLLLVSLLIVSAVRHNLFGTACLSKLLREWLLLNGLSVIAVGGMGSGASSAGSTLSGDAISSRCWQLNHLLYHVFV